jgi:hypothetical protein
MCTVALNVLEAGAFNAERQYFIPLFIKISRLCGQRPGGDEASNEGCNSGPTTGHEFMDNSVNMEGLRGLPASYIKHWFSLPFYLNLFQIFL